jgi:hypothetical protein
MELHNIPKSAKERLYYSVHKYHFSGDGSQRDWEESFGNLQWLPPDRIVIGEFGWDAKEQKQEDWASRFMSYLQTKNITNTVYWTIAHSGDTGNLFNDDCQTINWRHYNLLKKFWDKQMHSPQRRLRFHFTGKHKTRPHCPRASNKHRKAPLPMNSEDEV